MQNSANLRAQDLHVLARPMWGGRRGKGGGGGGGSRKRTEEGGRASEKTGHSKIPLARNERGWHSVEQQRLGNLDHREPTPDNGKKKCRKTEPKRSTISDTLVLSPARRRREIHDGGGGALGLEVVGGELEREKKEFSF